MNKKYYFIDSLDLRKEFTNRSVIEIAEEWAKKTGNPKANIAACLRYRMYRDFTEEERKDFKQERKFHKNRKKLPV